MRGAKKMEFISQQVRYPIGEFSIPSDITKEQREVWGEQFNNFPEELCAVVKDVKITERSATYREGSWTVAQLVHHIADANMNYFIRFKLAVTEENPFITPFDENIWAETADAIDEMESSLCILKGLHKRWCVLLRTLQEDDWQRTYQHPQFGASTLEEVLAKCVWHSYHHLGHIKIALNIK